MPEPKTIEIDEIVIPGKSGGDPSGDSRGGAGSSGRDSSSKARDREATADENPFSDFRKALPWKARITLALTRWFMLLRRKSWGMLILVPLIILSVLLAIPLIAIAIVVITLRSVFFPRRD